MAFWEKKKKKEEEEVRETGFKIISTYFWTFSLCSQCIRVREKKRVHFPWNNSLFQSAR